MLCAIFKHMKTRLDALEELKTDAWYGRCISKLKKIELEICETFIKNNDGLDRGQFEMAVNRMFIHVKDKPKQWTMISEILAVANIRANP